MEPLTVGDDMISDASITVPTPLYLLATLGLCCLAMLGKAFASIWNARAATEVGMVYAGLKEPLLPPPRAAQPVQPPPTRQPRGPPGAWPAVEQWIESLIATADSRLDTISGFPSSCQNEVRAEGPKVVTTLNEAALPIQILKQKRKEKKQRHRQNKQARKSEQQIASRKTSELLDGKSNGSENAVAATASAAEVERDAVEYAPGDNKSSLLVNPVNDEVSVVDEPSHEIPEGTHVPASSAPTSQSSQSQAVNEATTDSSNPSETEPDLSPSGTSPLESSSLGASCLPEQGNPSFDIFTQLRSIAITPKESHSQDFADLPEKQKQEIFEESIVCGMLKAIAASQRLRIVVDEHPGPLDDFDSESPGGLEGTSCETGGAGHEQLTQSHPAENDTLATPSAPDACTEAMQVPPMGPSTQDGSTEEPKNDRWEFGFDWSEDVEEEEEERRQQAEQERARREDEEQCQLEALRRSPTTIARMQQTLAPIIEDDEER